MTWGSDEVLAGCVVDGRPGIDDIFLEAERSGFDVRAPIGATPQSDQTKGVMFGFFSGGDFADTSNDDNNNGNVRNVVSISLSQQPQRQSQEQVQVQVPVVPINFKAIIDKAILFRSDR